MGEAAALGSAFFTALSSLVIRSHAMRIGVWDLNATLALFNSLFYLVMLFPSGQAYNLWHTPGAMVALTMLTGVTGLAIGGSAYIKGLEMAGVSRAFPVQMSSYALFTMILAFLLLRETFSVPMLIGVLLILLGIYLVAGERQSDGTSAARIKRGLALSLGAGLVWAFTTFILRIVLEKEPVLVVNTIRMPTGAFSLVLLSLLLNGSYDPRRYGGRTLAILGATGFLVMGMSSLLFILSIAKAGMAKAAILSSTSPLFSLPMAFLLGKEKVTVRVVAGTALSVLGIVLIL